MITSPTPSFLTEIAAGHSGPMIPSPIRAYFQQRLRNRVFNYLINKFSAAQGGGLTKAVLSRRVGSTPALINRWLGAPSNLTLDTISDLLLGIAGEELELYSSSPVEQKPQNYSHFDDLKNHWWEIERAKANVPPPLPTNNPLGIGKRKHSGVLQ
jgi:hypothetical protein